MIDETQKREQKLAAMKKLLIAQEAESREIFDRLGISPMELLKFFQDESHFPAEVWKKIEQERKRIEARLDSKIEECTSRSKDKSMTSPSEIKGHWIFLR